MSCEETGRKGRKTRDAYVQVKKELKRVISSGSLGCPSVRMEAIRLMERCRAASERHRAALRLYIDATKSHRG